MEIKNLFYLLWDNTIKKQKQQQLICGKSSAEISASKSFQVFLKTSKHQHRSLQMTPKAEKVATNFKTFLTDLKACGVLVLRRCIHRNDITLVQQRHNSGSNKTILP